jgi:putative nucleotidyltransferase with HDIG domain
MSPISVVEPTASQRAEIVLNQLRDLPSLPAVVIKLLELTSDDQADLSEIISLIETDPPLAAKVLSAIRKARFGGGGGADTVEKAVLMLGIQAVRNLVLAVGVLNVFRRVECTPAGGSGFSQAELWKHCLAVGCAAELLAGHLQPKVNPTEAFVGGLLHDLGKIALYTVMPKSYERALRVAASRHGSLADAEREVLGLDHMIAGKRVGRQWRLPDPITACMWLHHYPPDALPASVEQVELIRIVHVADVLAREMRIGHSGNHGPVEPSAELAAALGIDAETHAEVIAELASSVEARAQLIDMDDLTGEGLYLEALNRANRELASLNETLTARNRELEVRSGVLEACSSFGESLDPSDTVSHVCLSAARALQGVLQAASAAVCCRPESDGAFHIGTYDGSEGSTETVYVGSQAVKARTACASAAAPTLLMTDWTHSELLGKAGDILGAEPTSTVSVCHAGRVVGIALVTARPGGESRLAASLADARPLVAAIGSALSNASARSAAEKLAEDLSEASRRLHESQQKMLRQRTLSMISEMSGGAAHELNNPLSVIAGRAQMLEAETDPGKIQATARVINEQAHRCSEIVSELLRFAQPQRPHAAKLDLSSLLTELRAGLLERSPLESENLVLDLSDAALTVYADREQILLALNELVDNALEAMTGRVPRLHINCHRDPADDQVVIAIRDNGRGMSAEVLKKAFDPFYSERPAGRGRGMGLCHAYRMVEINGGQLRLESARERGTTALVFLPASSENAPLV